MPIQTADQHSIGEVQSGQVGMGFRLRGFSSGKTS